MTDKNISAYTAPGASYPPYISINQRGVSVEITVRSPAKPDGTCGDVSSISLARDYFDRLISDAQVWQAGQVELSEHKDGGE